LHNTSATIPARSKTPNAASPILTLRPGPMSLFRLWNAPETYNNRPAFPMPTEPKLPEIERGTEVFAVDPLTIRSHFEVDYIHSYKQDTPFFHWLAKRNLLGSHCARCK